MAGNDLDRAAQFDQELAALKIKSGSSSGERAFANLSLFVMVVGVILTVVANTTVVSQSYTVTTGLMGVAITVAGGALFLRFSLGQYLRYWLLRQIHESRVQTDRVVGQLGGAEGGADWPRVWPDKPGAKKPPTD